VLVALCVIVCTVCDVCLWSCAAPMNEAGSQARRGSLLWLHGFCAFFVCGSCGETFVSFILKHCCLSCEL